MLFFHAHKKLVKTLFLLLALPFTVLAVSKISNLQKSASGLNANIKIYTDSNLGSVPSSLWQNLGQGGEEPRDMLAPILPLVTDLSPKYIRIDHLFDYFDVYQGPNSYDFSRLDPVIDTILKTGAKPLLSLSYTPAKLSKNGQVAGEPQSYSEWQALISATAKHYTLDKNISGIYYEVGNEPDLFGGWKYNRNPNYLTLYTQTAQALATTLGSADYKVGGPATTNYYQNWMKAVLNNARQNRLRLDFISWHQYSENVQTFLNNIESFNSLLSNYPEYLSLQKILTEVGPNSEPDPNYAKPESGIHLISMSLKLAGYFHKLFHFEIVDGPQEKPNNSGWGLISNPNFGKSPKPRYFAIKFLNQLTGNRLISEGDGNWVNSLSSRLGNKIQTLIVNYDPKDQHVETVPLTYLNLIPGTYQIKTQNYLGDTTTQTVSVDTSGQLNRLVYLDSNTAKLLELEKLP